jgi:hypothetical protein
MTSGDKAASPYFHLNGYLNERRQAVRERVISRLNEEIDNSEVVVDQADDGSEVSVDQGFQRERRRTDVVEEMEFESQEQERRW